MFEAPFHPKIVHLPIALSILMPLITAGLIAAWWNSWLPRRSWYAAVALQGLLFAGSWAATETGEWNEEKVEEVLTSEEPLEEHEERAEQFYWATLVVFLLMILPVGLPTRRSRRGAALLALAGTLVVLWMGFRVGDAGGKLVYEHSAAEAHTNGEAAEGAPPPEAGGAETEQEGEHDD